MTKDTEVTLYAIPTTGSGDARRWITEGEEMARTDPAGVFDTIQVKHGAEVASHETLVKRIDAKGAAILAHWTAIKDRLEELGFDLAAHLHALARGKFDLGVAVALLLIGVFLNAFAVYAYAPLWLTVLLGFLAVASATAIEELFDALSEKAALREGVFLTLSLLFVAAQFWLGALRGVLLTALAPVATGPATHALEIGASVMKYTLGIFSIIAEVMAGYKLWRARSALLSPTAQAVRERDRRERELLALRDAMERAKAEPEIRLRSRTIGAREQLAWSAGAEERARASHLKRALKGAIIALLAIGLLLFLVSRASAAPVDSRNKAILLDLSQSQKLQDLKANIDEISGILGQLQAGDRIVVVGISGEFGRPLILLDEAMPGDAGHYGLQGQASRETIIAKWKQTSKDLKPTFPRTDILGAISTLSYLAGFTPSTVQIFILSDMEQCTAELDLEHTERIPVEKIIIKLKQAGDIPSLKGSQVFALGVDPVGKSRIHFSGLREFWAAYFRESGAELRVFAIDRNFTGF